MSEYLLAVHWYADAPPPTDEGMTRAYAQVEAFNDRLKAGGHWVFAGGLNPPDDATVVDASGITPGGDLSAARVSLGPANASDVRLGGFWVIDADDRSAAVQLAREASAACMAPVEVRPFLA